MSNINPAFYGFGSFNIVENMCFFKGTEKMGDRKKGSLDKDY